MLSGCSVTIDRSTILLIGGHYTVKDPLPYQYHFSNAYISDQPLNDQVREFDLVKGKWTKYNDVPIYKKYAAKDIRYQCSMTFDKSGYRKIVTIIPQLQLTLIFDYEVKQWFNLPAQEETIYKAGKTFLQNINGILYYLKNFNETFIFDSQNLQWRNAPYNILDKEIFSMTSHLNVFKLNK